MNLSIRSEQPEDIEPISELVRAAFRDLAASSHNEHRILHALRREKALALSMVAIFDDRMAGYVAFSEVNISDGSTGWYGLCPLAVIPDLQGRGIGSALVRAGLVRLRGMKGSGCVVLGNPSFYRRFGFTNEPELVLEETPQENFLALSLNGGMAHGVVTFHPIFYAPC